MIDKDRPFNRKQWFAMLKGELGIIHDEQFGLFLEAVSDMTTPFEIDHPSCFFFGNNCPCRRNEPALEKLFKTDSCGKIATKDVAMLVTAYEQWRELSAPITDDVIKD